MTINGFRWRDTAGNPVIWRASSTHLVHATRDGRSSICNKRILLPNPAPVFIIDKCMCIRCSERAYLIKNPL